MVISLSFKVALHSFTQFSESFVQALVGGENGTFFNPPLESAVAQW